MPTVNVTRAIADHIASVSLSDYDDADVELAQWLIVDSLANAVAGAATEPGILFGEYAESHLVSGNDEASVAGSRSGFRAKDAAFVNAQLAALLDMDETYANLAHAGSPIVFAALAVAERDGASRDDLLRAVLTAYDLTARIVDAMRASPEKLSSEVYPFSSPDAFGPAIAAAVVLGLDAAQTHDALGFAGGTARLPIVVKQRQSPKGVIKNAQGWHAEHGVIAVDLANLGAAGVAEVLDGAGAFWRAAGSDRWMPEAILDGLGKDCRIRNASFKAQPACRLVHTAIEAAHAAVKESGCQVEDLGRIEILTLQRIAGVGVFADPRPTEFASAQFSIPYTVAVSLLGIAPGPAWYSSSTMTDERVLSLAQRIFLIPDTSGGFDAAYGKNQRCVGAVARVEAGGRNYVAERAFAIGDPESPYDREGFTTRTMGLLSAGHPGLELEDILAALNALSASVWDARVLGRAIRRR